MSGVEVAGFALAAFPMLISALEHYRDSAAVVHNWWHFERKFDDFKYEIEYQQQQLKQNLELYLLPLIVDDDQRLQALIQNPWGPEWKNHDLEEKLKERIAENYGFYMRTIKAMNGVMEKLKSKISIGGSTTEHEIRRFIFGLDQSPRQELLDKMEMYNNRLGKLLRTGDMMTDLRKSAALTKVQRRLLSFWKHSNAIYCLLQCAWKRECCRSHYAHLLLEHRKEPEVNFTVLFHAGDKKCGSGSILWLWNTVCIKLFESMNDGDEKTIVISQDVAQSVIQDSTPPQESAQIRGCMPFDAHQNITLSKRSRFGNLKDRLFLAKRGKRPSVSVSVPVSAPSTPAAAGSMPVVRFTNTSPSSSGSGDPKPPPISDLCITFAKFQSTGQLSGILEDEENEYALIPLEDFQTRVTSPTTVSLEALLGKASPIVLTRRDRLSIALSIASSHLQLHPTPWVESSWQKKHIRFLVDPENENRALVDKPYLCRDFIGAVQTSSGSPENGDFSFCTLGILLLELNFNVCFEDYEPRRKIASTYAATDKTSARIWDQAIATGWCSTLIDDVGPEYTGAVRWCLERTFSKQHDWRVPFIQQVIQPLENCFNGLSGVKY